MIHTPAEKQNMQYMTEAYLRGKLSHAYILEGSKGTGKEEFAQNLAEALLCEKKQPGELKACGICSSCIKARTGNHPDIIHVRHEKETVLSVQEIREQVVADISIKPYYGPYKIYIIHDAELMNENAQNALLKTIEEPAEYGVLLLLTDNADSFLPTILSRCICIRMGSVPKEKIVEELMQGEGEQVLKVLHGLKGMDALAINKTAKEFEAADRQQILSVFELYFRDLLVWKSTEEKERLYFQQDAAAMDAMAKGLAFEKLGRMLHALEKAEAQLSASVKAEAAFESFLLAVRRELR